jgi:hypothetical protein
MASSNSTTAITISSLLGDLSQYTTNPASIQKKMMLAIKQIRNGEINVVDASNAFVNLLEATSVNTALAIQEAQALTRKQYPAAATTMSDLYLHMSDTDFVNAFALPTTAKFNIIMDKAQLIAALVSDADTGISQVTIPRNSVFYAAGVPFSIQYPINIRQLQHGGLQAVYDATTVSPLQNLDTNVLTITEVVGVDQNTYITFTFDTQQFDIVSVQNDVNSTGGFSTSVAFTEQFYYCRVYRQNTSGAWVEMPITYTQDVYDVSTPTAFLQVIDKELVCNIPVVYVTSGLIRGKIRIDVYETKGPMVFYMGNYQVTDFSASFKYLDSADGTLEVAALQSITNMVAFSQDITTAGRDALSFSELQSRVISNSIGPRQVPITPAQIQNLVIDDGYTIVKSVDIVTTRQMLATKSLPSPQAVNDADTNTYTPAPASIITLVSSIAQNLLAYGVTTHDTGITITSQAVMYTNNGQTNLLSSTQYNQLTALSLTDQAKTLNSGKYSTSPFYYVYDDTQEEFVVRPYFLDLPTIPYRTFVQENATTGLQVSISESYSIAKASSGYQIVITTSSNDSYQALEDSQVFCQLAFPSSSGTAYMLGHQQIREDNQGERTFVFDITTNYDIDSSNKIALSSFTAFGSSAYPRCDLEQSITVYFGTTATMPNTYSVSTIDSELGTFQLNQNAVAITQEQIDVKFGFAATTLWNRYRSFASTIPYQTYSSDVVATYDNDVYELDPITGAAFSVENGELQFTILHRKGDAILDGSGNPTYSHYAGDPVLDLETGDPLPVANYQTLLMRSVDLFAINAIYSFANDTITTEYISFVKEALYAWLTEDLVRLNEQVLENTTISFYPQVTQGTINVLLNNNVRTTINADQSLVLTVYLSPEKIDNTSLKNALSKSTIIALGKYFSTNSTISTSGLSDALKAAYAGDVVDFSISGLAGQTTDVVISILDESAHLSIGKALAVQTNNQLAVKENLTINFLRHG